eukprot:m.123232 g.123232  ORF g.123232 m.123232 type:complete len:520 (-) comp28973_c1_seq1:114-1673(-)
MAEDDINDAEIDQLLGENGDDDTAEGQKDIEDIEDADLDFDDAEHIDDEIATENPDTSPPTNNPKETSSPKQVAAEATSLPTDTALGAVVTNDAAKEPEPHDPASTEAAQVVVEEAKEVQPSSKPALEDGEVSEDGEVPDDDNDDAGTDKDLEDGEIPADKPPPTKKKEKTDLEDGEIDDDDDDATGPPPQPLEDGEVTGPSVTITDPMQHTFEQPQQPAWPRLMAQAHFSSTPVERPRPKKYSSPWERALAGTDKLFEAVELQREKPDSAKKEEVITKESGLSVEELAWEEKQKLLFDQRMEGEDELDENENGAEEEQIGGRAAFDLRDEIRMKNREAGRERGRDNGSRRGGSKGDNKRSRDADKDKPRDRRDRDTDRPRDRDRARDDRRADRPRDRDVKRGRGGEGKVTEITVDQFGRTREIRETKGRRVRRDDSKRVREQSPPDHDRSNKRSKFRSERKRRDGDDVVEVIDKKHREPVNAEAKEMNAKKRKKLLQQLKEVELAIARKKAAQVKASA